MSWIVLGCKEEDAFGETPNATRGTRMLPMIVRQSSGHFSREKGRIIVRHYRYFLTISQQKPGKRYFLKFWRRGT